MQCATCTQTAFREKGVEVELPLLVKCLRTAVGKRRKNSNYYSKKKEVLKTVRDKKKRGGEFEEDKYPAGRAKRVAPVFDRSRGSTLKTSLSQGFKKS